MKTGIKIGATALALTFAAAGGVVGLKAHNTAKTTEALSAQVKDVTRDPESTHLRRLKLYSQVWADGEHVHTLCGEINGKNGFGAYTGYHPFITTDSQDGFWDAHLNTVHTDILSDDATLDDLKSFADNEGSQCADFDNRDSLRSRFRERFDKMFHRGPVANKG